MICPRCGAEGRRAEILGRGRTLLTCVACGWLWIWATYLLGDDGLSERLARDEYRRMPKSVGDQHWLYVETAGLSLYCNEGENPPRRVGLISWRTIRACRRAKPRAGSRP